MSITSQLHRRHWNIFTLFFVNKFSRISREGSVAGEDSLLHCRLFIDVNSCPEHSYLWPITSYSRRLFVVFLHKEFIVISFQTVFWLDLISSLWLNIDSERCAKRTFARSNSATTLLMLTYIVHVVNNVFPIVSCTRVCPVVSSVSISLQIIEDGHNFKIDIWNWHYHIFILYWN